MRIFVLNLCFFFVKRWCCTTFSVLFGAGGGDSHYDEKKIYGYYVIL